MQPRPSNWHPIRMNQKRAASRLRRIDTETALFDLPGKYATCFCFIRASLLAISVPAVAFSRPCKGESDFFASRIPGK